MTEYEIATITETVAEYVLEKMKAEKHNKAAFYRIIDEFRDDIAEFDDSRGSSKSAISALARVHFEIRNPTAFKSEQADELRQFIRDILNVMEKQGVNKNEVQ